MGAVAVNSTGNGGVPAGTVYVADRGQNRVQRFSPDGEFERAWGQNVLGRNETQAVSIHFGAKNDDIVGKVSGSFELSFGGEAASFPMSALSCCVSINPTAATVQSGLEALSSIGAGNVLVSGGPTRTNAGGTYTITFTGALGGTDVAEMEFDGSQIVGPPPLTSSIETIEDGSGGPFAGFEICTVAADCKAGLAADIVANGGQLYDPSGIAVDQSTGDVYVYETRNGRISQFDADGNFIRAFGWDVVASGGTGDLGSDAYEICTVPAECKQAEITGTVASGGQFTAFNNAPRVASLAFGASGHLWATDASNLRLQEFDSSGGFIAAYGWDVDALGGGGELEKCTSGAPGACQSGSPGTALGQFFAESFRLYPAALAIDSSDNLYANDAGRVQRFDPSFSSAASFAPASLDDVGGSAMLASAEGGSRIVVANPTIREFDLAGELVETNIPGFTSANAIKGLAFDPSNDHLYVTNTSNPNRILVLGETADPIATLDPILTFDDASATFEGTVDPTGSPVQCAFQYSTDEVEWTSVPEPDCASLEDEAGAQAVAEDVEGLEPGAHYFVRLRVSRLYDLGSAVFSPVEEFTALSLPPVLSGVGAVGITDVSANLVGQVKPRSQLTQYRFQYTTAGFEDCATAANPACEETPEGEIVGSAQRLAASQISGLAPDTEYEAKLIATNVAGTTESPPFSLHTRATPPPAPDKRAYEMVSPPEKNGGGAVVGNASWARVGFDGQAIGFCSSSAFGDPLPTAYGIVFQCSPYLSRRTAAGWQTVPATPLTCRDDPDGPDGGQAVAEIALSRNAVRAVVGVPESESCAIPPLDPAAPLPQKNLYLSSPFAGPPTYELLAPAPAISQGNHTATGVFGGASEDLSHIVYASTGQQAAGAPAGSFAKIFEWVDGAVRLVSIDPGGSPFATSSAIPGASNTPTNVSPNNPVSANRIFFQNPDSGASQELYMRQTGSVTYHVSQSECSSACGASAADVFQWATPDGSRVLFTSAAKLSDEDDSPSITGADLYLYTHSGNPALNTNLTLLSEDSEPADGTAAEVQGLVGAGEDGTTVFFVAKGQLLAGQPTEAGPKLYRWSAGGGLEYLATLADDEKSNWSGRDRLVTPDGSRVTVETATALDPLADADEDRDVYRWDETGGWVCVSCQAPGEPSGGDATLGVGSSGYAVVIRTIPIRRFVTSEDAQRIFFATPEALLPGDVNDGKLDVYGWHDGTLSLISTGKDNEDVNYLGVGNDGKDVFLLTNEQLVGADVDSANDIYDARIGGGFPEPGPEAPCDLSAGACEGSPSAEPPSAPGPGSAAFQGAGNAVQAPKRNCTAPARRAKKLNRAARKLRKRARATRGTKRARRLRKRAAALNRKAKTQRKRSKRCRRAKGRNAR